MTLKPGDIVMLPFPFSDKNAVKKRPVLVFSDVDELGDFIGLAVTSSGDHDKSVELQSDAMEDGTLPKKSWVRIRKVYTLNDRLILGKFGTLKPTALAHVRRGFCSEMGCNQSH